MAAGPAAELEGETEDRRLTRHHRGPRPPSTSGSLTGVRKPGRRPHDNRRWVSEARVLG